jgi:hypothetical protein
LSVRVKLLSMAVIRERNYLLIAKCHMSEDMLSHAFNLQLNYDVDSNLLLIESVNKFAKSANNIY